MPHPSPQFSALETRHADPETRRRIASAMILVALITLGGTIGFVQIEDWSVWRAFYFTLVTITTVGYGDQGISEAGQKLATILLVCGVASASYAFSTIIQSSVASQLEWKSKMQKRINKLQGHIIVCGFGRMGQAICERLATRGRPFVVLERSVERLDEALSFGYLAVLGTGADDPALLAAGIQRASHIVAAVDSVAESIVIVMGARELNEDITIIARAERAEDAKKLERAGVNRVLCPFKSGGNEAVDYIVRPHVADFLAQTSKGEGDVTLAEVFIEEGSQLVGTILTEYGRDHADHVSFVALRRSDGVSMIPPRGRLQLQARDHLIVAGDPKQIATMERLAHRPMKVKKSA